MIDSTASSPLVNRHSHKSRNIFEEMLSYQVQYSASTFFLIFYRRIFSVPRRTAFHSAYLHLRVHRPRRPPRPAARASAAPFRPSWSQRHLSAGLASKPIEEPHHCRSSSLSVNVRTKPSRISAIGSSSWEREQGETRRHHHWTSTGIGRERPRERKRERDRNRGWPRWHHCRRIAVVFTPSRGVPRNDNCSQTRDNARAKSRCVLSAACPPVSRSSTRNYWRRNYRRFGDLS